MKQKFEMYTVIRVLEDDRKISVTSGTSNLQECQSHLDYFKKLYPQNKYVILAT